MNPSDSPSPQENANRWHHLVHLNEPGLIQGITFRLVDSMPASLRSEWTQLLQIDQTIIRQNKVQAYIDRGYGDCILRVPRVAEIVETCLLRHNGDRYRLLAWVIMPNHVHALIVTRPGFTLSTIVGNWKIHSARMANISLGRMGPVWYRDYYDRYIRDEKHLAAAVSYIHQNPLKAGLVSNSRDWPYSSARH
jgi:REP element-mobilizing transposase RayT